MAAILQQWEEERGRTIVGFNKGLRMWETTILLFDCAEFMGGHLSRCVRIILYIPLALDLHFLRMFFPRENLSCSKIPLCEIFWKIRNKGFLTTIISMVQCLCVMHLHKLTGIATAGFTPNPRSTIGGSSNQSSKAMHPKRA